MNGRRAPLAATCAAAVAVILGAGCTDGQGSAAPTPVPSVPSVPTFPSLPPPPLVEPVRTPLADPEPARWDYARPAGARALDVYFGIGQCTGLADARVTETATTVTVTVVLGTLPERTADTCSLVALGTRTRVPLSAPLGTRQVLDGHTDPPEPREVRS
jgi:hypothetical protein